jgi:hypothetical protein
MCVLHINIGGYHVLLELGLKNLDNQNLWVSFNMDNLAPDSLSTLAVNWER